MQRINTPPLIRFQIEGSKRQVIFCPRVVSQLLRHQQLNRKDLECGGQLFAKVNGFNLYIVWASGPNARDRRFRFNFVPNLSQQRKEIRQRFELGMHYVGDWHTHPEPIPKPSDLDNASMKDCFKKSKHELESFLMLIVGTGNFPECFWLSQHNATEVRRLVHITESSE